MSREWLVVAIAGVQVTAMEWPYRRRRFKVEIAGDAIRADDAQMALPDAAHLLITAIRRQLGEEP